MILTVFSSVQVVALSGQLTPTVIDYDVSLLLIVFNNSIAGVVILQVEQKIESSLSMMSRQGRE